jgi:hypothetical protein
VLLFGKVTKEEWKCCEMADCRPKLRLCHVKKKNTRGSRVFWARRFLVSTLKSNGQFKKKLGRVTATPSSVGGSGFGWRQVARIENSP